MRSMRHLFILAWSVWIKRQGPEITKQIIRMRFGPTNGTKSSKWTKNTSFSHAISAPSRGFPMALLRWNWWFLCLFTASTGSLITYPTTIGHQSNSLLNRPISSGRWTPALTPNKPTSRLKNPRSSTVSVRYRPCDGTPGSGHVLSLLDQ